MFSLIRRAPSRHSLATRPSLLKLFELPHVRQRGSLFGVDFIVCQR
jgi:hypothetical protein